MTFKVGIVLFHGFELLDVFGPVGLFSHLADEYTVSFHALDPGQIRSSQGIEVIAAEGLDVAVDIALVPGGKGTRGLVSDEEFIATLKSWALKAEIISSVCTGAVLLAQAGLLEGHRATTNKRAFLWVSTFGQDVSWVQKARWVQDENRWTSSGVAAGIDMTAALIRHLSGDDAVQRATEEIELEIHEDNDWDPYAAINGLAELSDGENSQLGRKTYLPAAKSQQRSSR